MPIVKAKIGPKIMSLICEEKIYDQIPVRKEVRAMVSGIYIMDVKGLRSSLEQKQGKVKFSQKMRMKLDGMREKEKAKIDSIQSGGKKSKKK